MSSSRNTTMSRRQWPSSHSVYYLNPFLSDTLSICLDWSSTCWRLCYNLLSAPGYLDDANLLRLSLVVLACHHVDMWHEAWVPPSTWIWLALFSFSSFFCLLWTRQEAAMATALVTLFVLEAVLPLVFVSFTTLLVWKQVTWMTGLTIMAIFWILLAALAHWIRQTVYQSLGHG